MHNPVNKIALYGHTHTDKTDIKCGLFILCLLSPLSLGFAFTFVFFVDRP